MKKYRCLVSPRILFTLFALQASCQDDSDSTSVPDASLDANSGGDAGPNSPPDAMMRDVSEPPTETGTQSPDAESGTGGAPSILPEPNIEAGADSPAADGEAGPTPPAAEAGADAPPDGGSAGPTQYFGATPNFWLPVDDPLLHQKAAEAELNAVTWTILWNEYFYVSTDGCDAGECPPCTDPQSCQWRPATDPTCRSLGYSELHCELERFLDAWLFSGGLPQDRALLLNIAISGPGEWRVGPPFLRALQQDPADIHAPVVWDAFTSFYDHIYEVISKPKYASTRWIVTLNSPAACTGSSSPLDNYIEFHANAQRYIRDTSTHPALVPMFGTQMPFFGRLFCNGPWDLTADDYNAFMPLLLRLSEGADTVAFVYEPLDPLNQWLPLNPARAVDDMSRMKHFQAELEVLTGRNVPIIVGPVSYGSDSLAHGQVPGDLRYSQYSDGEEAQRVLVRNLLTEVTRDPQSFLGFFWNWFFDIGTYDSLECLFWAGPFQADIGLRRSFCTAGLLRPYGTPAPEKPAWLELVNRDSLAVP